MGSANIDSLNIKINADASSASKQLDNLAKKLNILSQSLNSLQSGKMRSLANGITALSSSMTTLKGSTNSADFTRLSKNLQSLSLVNVAGINNTASAIRDISSATTGLAGVGASSQELGMLAVNVGKLGGAGVSKANANIPLLASAIGTLANSINGANLGQVQNFANGVNTLTNAMTTLNGGVKSADVNRVAKNIEKLANVNANGINNTAVALSTISRTLGGFASTTQGITNMSNLVGAIGKLGGANVQKAITNLPQLSKSLIEMMNALSRAPQVSANTVALVQALGNLNGASISLSKNANGIKRSMNLFKGTAREMRSTKNEAKSLAQAFGKFYASYFILIRGFKKLWSSIKQSMDYVEVLNYFNKSFSKVAESSVKTFGKAGSDSADAFYSSFMSRAKRTISDMSGYMLGDNGFLSNTGRASLGIDPTELMNYQAMFLQMSDSMGVSSKNASLLSDALVKIGGDLASLRNMDFAEVWGNMASGLVGMSRTLDKYGINIRNANLQQKLSELGIKANVSALSQADKALLRTIIIIERSEGAWSDLAETIGEFVA